jgi:hypothetical protein
MAVRRILLGLVIALALGVAGFAVTSMLAQAQQPSRPYPSYPPYPPPDAYPQPAPPPLPFPFPIPFPDPAARDLLLDGADKLIRALERMILTIPTYDPPVVTPEGDILLKRRHGAPLPPPLPPRRLPEPAPDRTTL